MKTCNDCLHYNICKNNNTLCHTSRLTSDSDITERCSDFADRSEWVHLPSDDYTFRIRGDIAKGIRVANCRNAEKELKG